MIGGEDGGVILRDRTYLTRLLVLRAFHEGPRRTLREVAEGLSVTVQAVSTYVRDLTEDGLVEERDGGHALTPRGLAEAQEGFARLKRAVDDAFAPLAVVDVTSAVAADRIRVGDEVGLFMEAGDLVARAGAASASRGRAITDATAGEEVVVRDLAGVVALRPGRVVLLRVPSPIEGGSHRVSARKVRGVLARAGLVEPRVGAVGTGAKVLVRKAGLPLHFEFASLEAAFNAAELGLDVALFATRDLFRDAIATLDARNAQTLHRVAVEILDLPTEGVPPEVRSTTAAASPGARGRRRR